LLTTARAFSGLARALVYLSGRGLLKLSISRLLLAFAFDIPTVRSKPIREKQYDEDDQDDADDTDAAVTEAIAVAAETATEATKQEDDEYDDEYQTE
jgi:hypothetical protein